MSPVEQLVAPARAACAAAVDAGASHAEVFLRYGPTLRMTSQRGYLSEIRGTGVALTLRVWQAGRVVLSTCTTLEPALLTRLAGETAAQARERGVPGVALPPGGPGPGIGPAAVPRAGALTGVADLFERLQRTVDGSPAGSTVALNATYSAELSQVVLVTAGGFTGAYPAQRHRLWLWLQHPGGHAVVGASGHCRDDLDPETLLGAVARLTAPQPAGRTMVDGEFAALLPPSAGAHVARALGQLLRAEVGDRLLSRVGRRIAAPAVTLVDDGTRSGGMPVRPFDDEGTSTQRTPLVQAGVLRDLLHTRGTATKAGCAANGKAERDDPWRHPRSAPSTLFLAPGAESPDTLLADLDRGLLVTDVLAPGQVSAAGRISLRVSGWWVQHGRRQHPVGPLLITAPVAGLLTRIRAVANDLGFSPLAAGAGAPTLLLERMRAP